MLRYCARLAASVRAEYEPPEWLWMTHTIGSYPQRFFSARYPLFYALHLKQAGCLTMAQIAALDWQSREDVQFLREQGIPVIGEIDVVPSPDSLRRLFDQCRKFGTDGAYIGILEQHSERGELTPIGRLCQELIRAYRPPPVGRP